MSNTDDSYADDYEPGAGAAGGGGGAILGVLMTLVIGCGLVFAAYKLGQRTSVDEPPLLVAQDGQAKMVPIDEGGTAIANQDNDAYTMIDEIRRIGTTETARRDGIVVDRLPDRALDPAGALAVTGVQEDALRIDELQLASSIEGEPPLAESNVPDRTGDLELAGGAEVQVADTAAILQAETVVANDAQRAAAERDVASLDLGGRDTTTVTVETVVVERLNRSADTQVVAAPAAEPLTEDDFGEGLVLFPMPRGKPDLAQRPESARIAEAPPPSRSPAVATTRVPVVVPVPVVPVPVVPVPGQAIAPTLQAQPLGIPPQPVGDAQVQLGAMPSPDIVRARWAQLRGQHPVLLGRLGLQIQPVRTAQGEELFRLRAGPLRDSRQAAQLCDQLRLRGVDCFVPAR